MTRCGATVTLNNTYWQAPTTLSAESTCSLSIQLNPTLAEQRRNPICQVRWVWGNPFFPILFKLNWISFWDFFRLDFEAFSIAGPNTQTVCATDNFRVSGTANRIPIICGQNVGQHSKRLPSYPMQSFEFFWILKIFFDSVFDCSFIDGRYPIDFHAGNGHGSRS